MLYKAQTFVMDSTRLLGCNPFAKNRNSVRTVSSTGFTQADVAENYVLKTNGDIIAGAETND